MDESMDSPQTPLLRTRPPPSPPRRSVCGRRRPPSPGGGTEEGKECDQNDGRFEREFCGAVVIGRGQFATVYRAQNRIDKCEYAVKKTTQISRGFRPAQLREVHALANVSGCQYIVRYHSSWLEDGRLFIQTELCDGSLRDRLAQHYHNKNDPRFGEADVVQVLRHVAGGLHVLHTSGFVHLDVKPDNILISRNPRDNGCYKLADLGLAAAAMGSGCDDISEGDCRYLAKEVLRGELSDLPRADVFALGLVCYEVATNPNPLPCNGEEWHRLREGLIPTDLLPPFSEPFMLVLQRMVHAVPTQRPLCEDIIQHPSVREEGGIQALHERCFEAEREAAENRRLAKQYYDEMLGLTKKYLLGRDDEREVSRSPRRRRRSAGGRGLRPLPDSPSCGLSAQAKMGPHQSRPLLRRVYTS